MAAKNLTVKLKLIFVGVLSHIAVFAQTDTTTVGLKEVVIHANRIQPGFDQESSNVIVIKSDELKAAPVVNVVDVLRYYAGIDIRQRGANGVQTDPGIRGSTFDQVLILVNGIKMSDPQTGHHSLNLPVDISNVDRIEIMKGPAARIYGQNAFAGAINIITKVPDSKNLNLSATGGDFGLWGAKIGATLAGKKVAQFASVSHDQSDGYKYNTAYKMTNYFYQAQVKAGAGSFRVLTGLTDRKFGANGFYASENFQDQYEQVQTSLVSIQYDAKPARFTVQPRLYWRRNHDDYVFVRSNPDLYHNIHTSNTVGVEVNSTLLSPLGVTGIGVDVNRVILESNNLGNHQRSVATLFLEHRFLLLNNKLDVTPGAQLNYYSDFGLNVFPGINVGFAASKKIRMFGNMGYTYRVPTFTDLYYSDPANLGNPNLVPEKALSYEVGVRTSSETGVTGQVSYFLRQGKQIIDWVKAMPTDPWQPQNVSSVNMSGFDMNATLLPQVIWHSGPLIQQLSLNYTYITKTNVSSEAAISRYALENLTHQFSAGLQLRYLPWLFHSVYYRYSDRVNMPDYSVVDSRLRVVLKRFSGFVDVTNIFDVTYKETNLVTMPGRWFKLGVSYNLVLNK